MPHVCDVGFLTGKKISCRETESKIYLYDGHKDLGVHMKVTGEKRKKRCLPEHEGQGRRKWRKHHKSIEERELEKLGEKFAVWLRELKRRKGQRGIKALYRLFIDYPGEEFMPAVERAVKYRFYDVPGIERIILKNMTKYYYCLPRVDPELEKLKEYQIGKVAEIFDLNSFEWSYEDEEEGTGEIPEGAEDEEDAGDTSP